MTQENTTLEEKMERLNPIEKKILLECGKQHVYIREETIKKKMPNSYLKDFNKSLNHLIAI